MRFNKYNKSINFGLDSLKPPVQYGDRQNNPNKCNRLSRRATSIGLIGTSLAMLGVGEIASSADGVSANRPGNTPVYTWQQLWDARKSQVLQANPSQVFLSKDDVFTYAMMRQDCDGGYETVQKVSIDLRKDRRTIDVSVAQTVDSVYYPIANNFANQTANQPAFGFSVQCDDFTKQRRTVEIAVKKSEKSWRPIKMSGKGSRIMLPQHNKFTTSVDETSSKRKNKVFVDKVTLRTPRRITNDELKRKLAMIVFYSERTERVAMSPKGKIRTMAGTIWYRPLSSIGKTTRRLTKQDTVLSASRNKRPNIMTSAIK